MAGHWVVKRPGVVVIFTQWQPDVTRVISLRKAKKHERESFEEVLQD